VEKRMMGPKPEKTTFWSNRSALGGSGAVGEGGAEGVGAVGLEYLSSSGCSSLGNAEKSGELCRDEPMHRKKRELWLDPRPPPSLPTPIYTAGRDVWLGNGEAWFPGPVLPLCVLG
jgi:hypothetical protein